MHVKRTTVSFSATRSRGGKAAQAFQLITHHLFVLLQQRAGQVQLRAGVHWDQGEAGRGGAHELDHSGLHSWIRIGQTGLVPHGHFQYLGVTKQMSFCFLFFFPGPGCAAERRWRPNGSHLFSESPARRPDPVLIVAVSRGARQDEAHAGLVLGPGVAEELGGLQHPGSRPPLEQHVFRRSQRHHGNRCRVDRLRDNTASSSDAHWARYFTGKKIWVNLQLAGQNKLGGGVGQKKK